MKCLFVEHLWSHSGAMTHNCHFLNDALCASKTIPNGLTMQKFDTSDNGAPDTHYVVHTLRWG